MRNNGKIIPNAPIRGQCSKNNFYRDEEIENIFSQIERKQSKVLKRINSVNSIDDLNEFINDINIENSKPPRLAYFDLLEIIMFQKSRTEFEAKNAGNGISKLVKEIFLKQLEHKGENELLKYKNEFDIISNETETVLFLIKTSLEMVPAISDLAIYILENKTDIEFIFSDSPVVFYNKAYQHIGDQGVLGFQSPGLLIFFPISPIKCILLIDEQKYSGKIIKNNFFKIDKKSDVDSINKLQLHNSLNSIYFSQNLNSNYIKKIWRQQKNNFSSSLFNYGEGLVVTESEKESELVYLKGRQMSYNLKLSFLDPIKINFEGYMSLYRDAKIAEMLRTS